MNKKELLLKREETRRKYHMKGMPNHVKRAKNAIYFTPANGLRHELKKAEICYKLLKEKKWFITEAVNNRNGFIRDIVCLDDGQIYEVVDTHGLNKNDPETELIEVVKV